MEKLIRYALIKNNQRPNDSPAWRMLLSTQHEIDLVSEYVAEGTTIVKWLLNTGYTVLTKEWTVLEISELSYPEQPGENHKADIVVCENDAQPEEWWIQNLRDTFSDKTITTLQIFLFAVKKALLKGLRLPALFHLPQPSQIGIGLKKRWMLLLRITLPKNLFTAITLMQLLITLNIF